MTIGACILAITWLLSSAVHVAGFSISGASQFCDVANTYAKASILVHNSFTATSNIEVRGYSVIGGSADVSLGSAVFGSAFTSVDCSNTVAAFSNLTQYVALGVEYTLYRSQTASFQVNGNVRVGAMQYSPQSVTLPSHCNVSSTTTEEQTVAAEIGTDLTALSLSLRNEQTDDPTPYIDGSQVLQITIPDNHGTSRQIAIVNITVSQISTAHDIQIQNSNTNLGVIFNVPGSTADFTSLTYSFDSLTNRQIVWHFYEATDVRLPAVWYGTVIAPSAAVQATAANTQLNGGVFASSFAGSGVVKMFLITSPCQVGNVTDNDSEVGTNNQDSISHYQNVSVPCIFAYGIKQRVFNLPVSSVTPVSLPQYYHVNTYPVSHSPNQIYPYPHEDFATNPLSLIFQTENQVLYGFEFSPYVSIVYYNGTSDDQFNILKIEGRAQLAGVLRPNGFTGYSSLFTSHMWLVCDLTFTRTQLDPYTDPIPAIHRLRRAHWRFYNFVDGGCKDADQVSAGMAETNIFGVRFRALTSNTARKYLQIGSGAGTGDLDQWSLQFGFEFLTGAGVAHGSVPSNGTWHTGGYMRLVMENTCECMHSPLTNRLVTGSSPGNWSLHLIPNQWIAARTTPLLNGQVASQIQYSYSWTVGGVSGVSLDYVYVRIHVGNVSQRLIQLDLWLKALTMPRTGYGSPLVATNAGMYMGTWHYFDIMEGTMDDLKRLRHFDVKHLRADIFPLGSYSSSTDLGPSFQLGLGADGFNAYSQGIALPFMYRLRTNNAAIWRQAMLSMQLESTPSTQCVNTTRTNNHH